MQCPNCTVYFHEHIGENEVHVQDKKWESKGFIISTHTCPNCSQLVVVLKEGSANYDEQGFSVIYGKDSESKVIYPFTIAKIFPEEVPRDYVKDFNESLLVSRYSPNASAALSRRLLQKFLRHKIGVTKPTLYEEIDAFLETNPPDYIRKSVDAIRNIGNWAAHPLLDRETGTIVDVEHDEATWLLEILEDLFEYYFIRPVIDGEKIQKVNEKLARMGKGPIRGNE